MMEYFINSTSVYKGESSSQYLYNDDLQQGCQRGNLSKMVLLDNDTFLTELTRLFQKTRTSGAVNITMKQYYGQTKPQPRDTKRTPVSEHTEHKCLFRATNGKKKLSTVISSKDVTKFQMAYANVLKANMDNLKKRGKRDAKSKTKTNKAT